MGGGVEMMEETLKWIFLVLAAGFVGYFGRYLAMRLIRRLGGEKTERRETGTVMPQSGEDTAKLEKKRQKAFVKAEKKRMKAGEKKVER